MEIFPIPMPHSSEHSCVRIGLPPIRIDGLTACHGPAGTIVQGIGVNTPSAAAVAAATCGVAKGMHIPNGAMFVPGAISIMVAMGLEQPKPVN